MIRLFKMAKDSAIKARTQTMNQLKAVLTRTDPRLRDSLKELGQAALLRTCAAFQPGSLGGIEDAAIAVLHILASRILALAEEIRAHENALTEIVTDCAPRLLERHGVGPDTAACLLITAGDNPERLNSEAAFAALCGVKPIEASSGKTTRHRSISSSARSLAHSALCLRSRASSSRSDSAGSPPEPVSCSRASQSICTRWPTFPR
ncbi:transposase [Microbispora bryophytorum]|uniref:transposase n=1 Tax=Microbispora bryophytorum TaxID=1460882 RepID=UPI0033FD3C3F